ncbi:MAG: dethiobiotin synthase [Tsuneonella suprasediminis]|uniref:ATP-dependent dethiobiotin synthetase BioD n=1 Tax=Tsuneonella suprasediminis TaxID=2306996 RepID=A0A419R3Q5_9SPHN|nr:dethiobiotin synthase [Tsuneonella suprasediminis]RJX69154.1 ATP-dependent dethiobiotin synthetase BioD [Tsuneonella suprasediminis]UBS34172.1 dethiobiotin synthase [Altererythrobacter sp. N1]
MRRVIVVTGTDTDVGKTVFAVGLAAAIGAYYWKPVQAGLEDGTDTASASKLGVPAERIVPEAYRLATPCSPHRAAEIDGVEIDPTRLALPDVEGTLVVEGAGGALVPVTREILYADVFARWGQPTIVVARTGLGTINHSLLTIEALRARSVPILGIAFVGPAEDDSERTICEIARVPRLGRLPHLTSLDPDSLQAAILSGFDMEFFR